MYKINNSNNSSFTLIELLVVLALVAILSVVVILTLNPAELIKQARDSNRLSDLSTINTALNLFSADVTSGFMGTSTVVYVSLPSTISTCSDLGLPTLPSTYTYNCVTTQNLRNTDGTGWIPVNFQRISSNSPISQLPIDPVNTTTTRLYYTYTPGGSWELNATVEASKNKLGGSGDLASKDGGSSPSQYEIGNNLNLSPIETGDTSLVGYWNFEEGSGTTVYDRSGRGNDGTFGATAPVWEDSGKIGKGLRFSQASQYVYKDVTSSTVPALSMSFWFNVDNINALYRDLVGVTILDVDRFHLYTGTNAITWYPSPGSGIIPIAGQWYHVAGVYDGSTKKVYVDGVLSGTANISTMTFSRMIVGSAGASDIFAGVFDDVRYYTRALSDSEILGIYNSTK